jgi:hypothetical protein
VFSWSDGRQYSGSFKNEKRDGHGVYKWADGKQYQGNWKDGKQHGRGKLLNQDGKIKYGHWNEGVVIKWVSKKSWHLYSESDKSLSSKSRRSR